MPFYAVIGAALASAYHGVRQANAPSDLGMGLAVFDEASSKMDGPNQRTLLDFYRAIGLQVVIAAPTEKRAVVYENLDYIIDVFRSGDVSLAESIRIKDRVREESLENWKNCMRRIVGLVRPGGRLLVAATAFGAGRQGISCAVQMQDVAVGILEPGHLEPIRVVDAVLIGHAIHLAALELHALGAQTGGYDLYIAAAVSPTSST